MKDKRIVFSTDPRDFVEDRKGRQTQPSFQEKYDLTKILVIFRIEKNGRGGKTVTIMSGFPKNEELLKALTKELKSSCGVGGTYVLSDIKSEIEIQGDKREALKAILTRKGIKFKGM